MDDLTGAPVKTALPLNLVGTLVFQNPQSSAATIQDRSENATYAVKVDDEAPVEQATAAPGEKRSTRKSRKG